MKKEIRLRFLKNKRLERGRPKKNALKVKPNLPIRFVAILLATWRAICAWGLLLAFPAGHSSLVSFTPVHQPFGETCWSLERFN